MPASWPTSAEYIRLLPETILAVFGTLIMLLEGLAGENHRRHTGSLAIAAILLAIGGALMGGADPGPAFSNFVIVDGFATFFRVLVLVAGLLAVLCSTAYLTRENADSGEFFALVLFSLSGQCLLAAANELIMVFIGIEISSIATYVMAGFLRDDKRNNESAVKYFLLGSFATAFLLYGVAWICGLTGSTISPRSAAHAASPPARSTQPVAGVARYSPRRSASRLPLKVLYARSRAAGPGVLLRAPLR
ncbi:MAG: proton-conducting transporter membrane subunit [Bryobacteraceae bacterium]